MEFSLSIVIPVFNEENGLRLLYNTWVSFFSTLKIPYRFVFINDGSTDNSLQVLNGIAANDQNVTVFSQMNQGHGPAIIRGYKASLNTEWILQMDADNPYDTDAFEKMWRQKEYYDFLVGDRKKNNGSLSRKLVSQVSVLAVAFLTGKVFKNNNTPYRLMRSANVKEALNFIPANSFAPNIMLTIYYLKKRKRILVTSLQYKQTLLLKKSGMSSYIAGGAVKSLFQIFQFCFRL